VTLVSVPSDAGVAALEGGEVSVRIAGTEALLEIDGEQYPGCVEDRRRSIWADARLRGVTVRAVGNEPGWQIEITDGGQIHFLFDYGQREALVPTPEPVVNAAARVTVYHAVTSDYDLLVEIEVLACTDSMSGEEFSRTVTVEFEGRVFYGCGR
jgi:putative lipoprotein